MNPTTNQRALGLAGWYFPVVVLLVCGGWFLSNAIPPAPGRDGIDYTALGERPVREGGRVMPLETFASSNLQSISGLTEVKDEKGALKATAVQWLVQVMDSPRWDAGPAASLPVFRIDNDQLLAALELPRKPGFYHYSVEEIMRSGGKLDEEFDRVDTKRKAGKPLDLYDSKVEELGTKLHKYRRLATNQTPQAVPPEAGRDWTTLADIDKHYHPSAEDLRKVEDRAMAAVEIEAMRLSKQYKTPDQVPEPERLRLRAKYEEYFVLEVGRLRREHRAEASPAAAALTRLLQAARDGKGEAFGKLLAEYDSKYLASVPAAERANARLEAQVLGQFAPFYNAAFLYLFVLMLAAVGWLGWTGPLHRAAFWLGVFTFAMHTAALVIRMYVQGRPPVTNLYASAVFIGWGAVGLCLVLERIYRNGIGSFIAGVAGAATLKVAHFLSGSGDTMAMLQAVLDTNFWLASHVTTVTLGYTATYVAGLIAIVYLVRGVFTTSLTRDQEKTLGQMMYGVICFATLLSFVGTVLGGLWADYSWGRFWGWDPKENGAVMIVIWNVLILHARWAGLVKTRGMAVLAVFGNVITAWSWFGTNQLQIGLHSYGFDNRLATGCRWFWISQLVVIAIGLIPVRYWRSGRHLAGTEATPAGAKAGREVATVNGHMNGHPSKLKPVGGRR